MKFLEHDIPDLPADCARGEECLLIVRNMDALVRTMSQLTQNFIPSNPGQESEDNGSDRELIPQLATDMISVLPAVMEKDEYVPSAQRCGGCIISCALKVVSDGGAV